ncbi:hypothetical protein [Aeromonas hydrophila]|uniref:hypothetical protein n=1 Tax=Aeromonas hydrophila TaxID=644 RepID=UPI002B46D044|nr:hypothetical protein [Aeromonas hydrophila]
MTSSKLNDFSLVISTISTLISISALTYPLLKNSIIDKKPELTSVVVSTQASSIRYAIFNTGDAPAIIKDIRVSYPDNKLRITNFMTGNDLSKIIEPNKTYYFTAQTIDKEFLPLQSIPGTEATIGDQFPKNCVLEIIYQDFNNSESIKRTSYKCLAE